MHFKFKIWEFVENEKAIVDLLSPGVKLLQSSDSYVEKMFLDLIRDNDPEFKKLFSFELKREKLEEDLLGLDLFSSSKKIIYFNSEKFDSSCVEFIEENCQKFFDHHVIFLFSKDCSLLKKLKKKDDIFSVSITSPAFWEFDRLLGFLSKKLDLVLDGRSKQLLVENLEPSVKKYLEFLGQIKLMYPEKAPSFNEIKEALSSYRLDNFEFSTLLSQQKTTAFYQRLNDGKYSLEDLRGSFPFLISHVRKLYNTNYTQVKKKLSKYDKEILSASKNWKGSALLNELRNLSILDTESKLNPKNFKNELRKKFLKNLS